MRRNVSLKTYNTFGLDVVAAFFLSVHDLSDIEQLRKTTIWQVEKKLILGGGSNCLFLDDYYEGIVLMMNNKGVETTDLPNGKVKVIAAAGEDWTSFVHRMVLMALGGVENLSLIPGKVGAAPIQNIGAYGVELKDVFHKLKAFDLETGEIVDFVASDCAFGYRSSVFKTSLKGRYIILSVELILDRNAELNLNYGNIREELAQMDIKKPTFLDVSLAVSNIRRSKLPDPLQLGNAGSFFKNPVVHQLVFDDLKKEFPDIVGYPVGDNTTKLAAGWLIEKAGWKGVRKDDVGVHQQQALVIVNYGAATGRNIFDFAMKVQQSVKEKFGIQLEPEVNFIGW
jgi:UDP-N-acetylmuramate dehydrogenase